MSISVTFYKYTGDPRVANKSIENAVGTAVTLHPLEPISNLEVKMIINYQSTLMTANYFSADGMYYEITDRKRLQAEAMEITGRLDSVKSYWDQVKNCDSIVERSTVKYNSKIDDPIYPTEQKFVEETIALFNVAASTEGAPQDIIVFGFVE